MHMHVRLEHVLAHQVNFCNILELQRHQGHTGVGHRGQLQLLCMIKEMFAMHKHDM